MCQGLRMSEEEEKVEEVVEEDEERDDEKEAVDGADSRKRGGSFQDVGKKLLKEVVSIGIDRVKEDFRKGVQKELGGSLDDVDLEEVQGYVFGDYKHLMAGFVYMVTHDDTWSLVRIPVKVAIILSACAFLGLILVVYPLQAYALENAGITSSILAHFLSFGLVVVELFVSIGFIIVPSIYGTLVTRTFIHVYNDNSKNENWKVMQPLSLSCCCGDLKALVLRALFHFLTIWLHFLPYIGSYAYIYLNARFYTWELFSVYFERRGVTSIRRQYDLVKKLNIEKPFGAEAVALKTIPVAGLVFSLSNSVAAALYAVESIDPIEDLNAILDASNNDQAGEVVEDEQVQAMV